MKNATRFFCTLNQKSKKGLVLLLTLLTFFFSGISVQLYSQNTAHVNWDLLDKPTKRAIWMWKPNTTNIWNGVAGYQQLVDNHKNSQDNLIDFCRNKSINTIYLFVGNWQWDQAIFNTGKLYHEAGYAAFITKANAVGIRVWALYYLNDDFNDLTNYAAATPKIIDAIGGFNSRYPNSGFDGAQSDVEPDVSSNYSTLIDYLKLAQSKTNTWKTTLKNAGAKPFIFSSVIKPAWVSYVHTYNAVSKELFKFIIDAIDHIAIMDYYDTQAKLKFIALPALTYASSLNPVKPVAIGIETGSFQVYDPINTYSEEIKAETNLTRFNRLEGDLDAVEAIFKTYKAYERFAIHDMSQYFAHWFGAQQGDWLDKNSTWVKPPYVNLKVDASPFANWPNDIPVPGAPVITSVAPLSSVQDVAYTYTLTATDPNNKALTYSAKTLPSWLSFNPTTRVLSGTPTVANINAHHIVLQVSNGTLTTNNSFTIIVNSIPVLNAPLTAATASILYSYALKATDLNNDKLTYSVIVKPSWLTFNDSSNVLSGTPSVGNIGNNNVTVRVSDGIATVDQVFVLKVVAMSSSTNYLLLGDFESAGIWDMWAGTRSTSCARNGAYGVQLTQNEAGVQQVVTKLKPNTKYVLTAYLNTGGTNVTLGINKYDGVAFSQNNKCNSTVFTKYSLPFTTGASNTSANVFIYRIGNTTTVCADDFEVLEDVPLGMDNDNAIHELKVYPNPATSNAQVEFVLNEPATIMIELYNIQGQLVNTILNATTLQAGSYSQKIETHRLEKGIYYLRYSSNHQVQNMQWSILPH